MKKIKILLIVAMSALTFSSCSDAIDIVQEGELTDAAIFQSTSDLQKYLDGAVYSSVDITNEIFITSLLTDELRIGPANAGQQQSEFRFIITSGNGYASAIWLGNYTTINRANRLLEAAATITPTGADVAKYNNIIAQTRAIRAFSYLRLEEYFSTNTKDDAALGVIISDSVPQIGDQLPRSSNAAVWALVDADFAFAEANLTTNTAVGVNVGNEYYVGKAALSAMKARMYLYRGKYPEAKSNAQDAITRSGLILTPGTPVPTSVPPAAPIIPGSAAWNTAFYARPSINPYRNIWNDTSRGEKIFSLSRPEGGNGGIAGVYTTNATNLTGSPWWVVSLDLFAQYSSYTNDIRRYAFIDPTSSVANKDYVIDKYPGRVTSILKNDLKVFRISEMKLIIAEADARAMSYGTAATIIKEIRDARKFSGTSTLPVYTSVAGALADILKERRVELSFEGHRYIDLKRAGAEAGVSLTRNPLDDRFISSTPLTLSLTDYRFTLPIPAAEVKGNPGIQQNPGY